jgi:D-alanine-D-alanine ligase
MTKSKTVAILFGGKSVEHKVSLRSAKNIYDNIDQNIYNVVLIGISQKGQWYHLKDFTFSIENGEPVAVKLTQEKDIFFTWKDGKGLGDIDIFFPVLHGNDGEDGSIQGLIRTVNIPMVGTGVLGSAVVFDKICSKRLLTDAGIKNARFLSYSIEEKDEIDFNFVEKTLGLPFFVKPVASGSSVGVSKVIDHESFKAAIEDTFQYDNLVLIEEYIQGREIECSVMGNQDPRVSQPGEISVVGGHDFYSFDAKYVDDTGAKLDMPAKLEEDTRREIQDIAIKAYKTLYCEDFARVDMFLKEDGRIYVNEINSIPGFTHISMFPQLWKLDNISYTDLISDLIENAFKKYNRANRIKRDFESSL